MQWEYSNSPDNLPSTLGYYWAQELWTDDDTTWLSPMVWELIDDKGTLRFVTHLGDIIEMIDHMMYEELRFAGPIDHPDFKQPNEDPLGSPSPPLGEDARR